MLIAVVCVLDCHSIFQIALGTATWSISYHKNYKKILTAVILSLSISCNITGGILIALGNRRTRKKEVLEQRLHSALSEEAIRRREKARRKRIMHETLEEVRLSLVLGLHKLTVENRKRQGSRPRRRLNLACSTVFATSCRRKAGAARCLNVSRRGCPSRRATTTTDTIPDRIPPRISIADTASRTNRLRTRVRAR